MDNIGLKKKYFSLKMDNITVIKLKTLAMQGGIKGYYKLRKAELRESKCALKKFAIQYRVHGKDLIDPNLFLLTSKQSITNFMINT